MLGEINSGWFDILQGSYLSPRFLAVSPAQGRRIQTVTQCTGYAPQPRLCRFDARDCVGRTTGRILLVYLGSNSLGGCRETSRRCSLSPAQFIGVSRAE